MRGVNRFASALLSPFWLIGRAVAAFGWIWAAFLDGLGAGKDDDADPVLGAVLIWLVGLTVWVIFW